MVSSPLVAVIVLATLAAGAAAGPPRTKASSWFAPYLAVQPIPITSTRDVHLQATTSNIIAKYGYPSEAHTVRTADGYLLTVHRIPNPGKKVIYLQHGILSSSADWVVLGPTKALAFLLYDAGYDVWMGNFRGNTYSRAHATLTPGDKEFWNFSWHEIGMNDIPAMIDYILKDSQQSDLVYVGHSQGTTAFFVMASLRPEYNEKVSAFIAMAPVAFLGQVGSLPLKIIAKAVNEVEFVSNALGMYEFLPSSQLMSYFTSKLCSDTSIAQKLCTNVLFLIAGYDSEELDTEMLPKIMQNVPAGASTKQFVHFGQLINSDKFRQYDHGIFKNLMKYGSFSPPEYPLEKVSTRVFLHYADNDLLAVPKGVNKLLARLPNVKITRRVPHDSFNHLDFLYARDTVPLLYGQVMQTIDEICHGQNQTNSS